MTEPFSPDGPQQILTDLCRLAAERVPAEEAIATGLQARNDAAKKAFEEGIEALTARYRAEKASAEAESRALRQEATERFEREHAAVHAEYEKARQEIAERFENEKAVAEQEMQNAQWEATTIGEAAKGGSGVQLKEIQAQLEARWQELQNIHRQAATLLNRWGQWRDFADPQPVNLLLERHPMRRFCHALDLARTQYHALDNLIAPRLVQGLWPMVIIALLWGAMTVPAGIWFGWNDPLHWVMVSAAASLFVFVAVGVPVYIVAGRRSADCYLALRRTLLEAGVDRASTLETAKVDCQRLHEAIESRQRAEIGRANERLFAAMGASLARRERETAEIEALYPPRLAAIKAVRDQVFQQAETKYPPLLGELEARFTAASAALREQHEQTVAASKAQHEQQWGEMAQRWTSGVARVLEAAEYIRTNCTQLFPDWNAADSTSWNPPDKTPPAVRFGQITVQMGKVRGGIPDDPRLKPPVDEFVLPLLLPMPDRPLLLLKAGEAGRSKAIESLQAAMLRLLTSMPPGKIRFTIIDPVGLGENFSAFMHLADFDEQLVSSRIWTDTDHIEQRLADLTQHMENVIQVYLRNEFESILDYNAFAGEMAEPYRVLVIANFPANFTEAAVQRLKSIVASGARCGVFVLMSVDSTLDRAAQRPRLRPRRRGVAVALGKGPVRLETSRLRRRCRRPGRPAAARTLHRDRPRRGPRGPRRRPRRSAVQLRRSGGERLVERRQPRRHRRPPGPRRRDEAAKPRPRPRHLAARAHLRQDRLGQVDLAPRADHQPRPALQPRRNRAVPRRLQEGRRVQGLFAAPIGRTRGSSPSRASGSSA